jgi:hypothetical protein
MTSLTMVWFLVVNIMVTKLAFHVGQVSCLDVQGVGEGYF